MTASQNRRLHRIYPELLINVIVINVHHSQVTNRTVSGTTGAPNVRLTPVAVLA